jgi:mannose-6-phosphate isomerase-like protein (cupin superfamily)
MATFKEPSSTASLLASSVMRDGGRVSPTSGGWPEEMEGAATVREVSDEAGAAVAGEPPVAKRLRLRACQQVPHFMRGDPRVVFCHRGAFQPLDEERWQATVRDWVRPVTVVRRVAGTSVEGATMRLRHAYADAGVYIQCGLQATEPPEASAVWRALDARDREQVRRGIAVGGRAFGAFERVATFITPEGAPEATTSTHYDEYNGFLCVVRGTKQVYVASHATCSNTGKLNANETTQTPHDTAGFVKYTLHAGDVLYVPSTHWHYVVTPAETVLITLWFSGGESESEGRREEAGGSERQRIRR